MCISKKKGAKDNTVKVILISSEVVTIALYTQVRKIKKRSHISTYIFQLSKLHKEDKVKTTARTRKRIININQK